MITLEGFDPKMLVSANKRIHHHQRAKVCRYWREVTTEALADHDPKRFRVNSFKARVVVHVRFPNNIRRDVGNFYPYVAKPLVDAMVTAGWFPDDDDRYLVGPDLRRTFPNGPHQIRIEILETS